jgi:hypothetical protein
MINICNILYIYLNNEKLLYKKYYNDRYHKILNFHMFLKN